MLSRFAKSYQRRYTEEVDGNNRLKYSAGLAQRQADGTRKYQAKKQARRRAVTEGAVRNKHEFSKADKRSRRLMTRDFKSNIMLHAFGACLRAECDGFGECPYQVSRVPEDYRRMHESVQARIHNYPRKLSGFANAADLFAVQPEQPYKKIRLFLLFPDFSLFSEFIVQHKCRFVDKHPDVQYNVNVYEKACRAARQYVQGGQQV